MKDTRERWTYGHMKDMRQKYTHVMFTALHIWPRMVQQKDHVWTETRGTLLPYRLQIFTCVMFPHREEKKAAIFVFLKSLSSCSPQTSSNTHWKPLVVCAQAPAADVITVEHQRLRPMAPWRLSSTSSYRCCTAKFNIPTQECWETRDLPVYVSVTPPPRCSPTRHRRAPLF